MIKKRLYGILLTFGLAMAFLVIFFGNILRDPGDSWFARGGDGLKAYYTSVYHVQHDSLAFHSGAMNYPFGEVLPFTDSQPPVVNTIRLIAERFPGIKDHTVGIINLLMIFSILFGAVFLFLILAESGVSWWYAAIVATGIAFLSPQLNRMGGHFSLSWVFWIPLATWLIIRFDKARWLIYSFLLGVTTFTAGYLHFYYIGFIGFLLGGYWLFRFLYYKKASTFWYRDVLHIFLQFILPVLLLQLLVQLNDDVTDRTGYPFGYSGSTAHPVAIFLPSGAPWAFVSKTITVFRHISWESFAYIGTVALAGCFAGLFFMASRITRKETFHRVSPVKPLNVLFWVSFFALLFSFGIPFVFGLEWLYDHLGPFRQLRVLARFSWLFYYLVNVVVFASLYQKAFVTPARWWWKALAGVAVALLLFEAVFNTRGIAVHLNNRIAVVEDRDNQLPENQWVKKINPSDFQAIIPMPYFHVGSENVWIDNGPEIKEAVMLASLKTGLPTTGVELSRTSISQTYLNYSLYTEPLQRIEMVDYLPDDRPFLVLRMNGYEATQTERWLLREAIPLLSNDKFTLMSLSTGQIKSFHETWRRSIFQKYSTQRLASRDGFLVSDSSAFFRHIPFEEMVADVPFRGAGAFTFQARKQTILYAGKLDQVAKGVPVTIGFWIYRYQNDACLRTELKIIQKNSSTGETVQETETRFFDHLKTFQGEWALVELDFETVDVDETVEISVHHTVLPKASFVIDELLIREKGLDVWSSGEKFLIYNGRQFVRRENL